MKRKRAAAAASQSRFACERVMDGEEDGRAAPPVSFLPGV